MFNDIREFIDKTVELADCRVIDGADWDLEIGTIAELMAEIPNSPLLLFDNIKGYPSGYRVAVNLFSTPNRAALGLGLPLNLKGTELVRSFRDWLKEGIEPIPPVEVPTGPIKENVITGSDIDLYKIPTPKWHELDGGRYMGTGCCVIMRDPDEGWVNVSTYRVQIHDKSTMTVNISLGHHGDIIQKKYWEKGKSCPVAIACGQEPLLFAASAWEHVAWGVSEYDFAGGLRGKPVLVTHGITTDLPIPATAEIVIEGEIVPPSVETRLEGPFGEWCGYYAGVEKKNPAMRVNAILHRNNPILQGSPPSRFPGVFTLGRHYQKAASLWADLEKHVPGVMGVRMIEDASIHTMAVISLKQQYEGHAKQAALLAAGNAATGWCLRFVIVVDDDIDPFDTSRLLWALGTRCDPETAIDVIRGCWGARANPLRTPAQKKEDALAPQNVGIILACKPYAWIKDFPPSVESSPELREKIREKWSDLFRNT
jgi:UbiD family decarboxylase